MDKLMTLRFLLNDDDEIWKELANQAKKKGRKIVDSDLTFDQFNRVNK